MESSIEHPVCNILVSLGTLSLCMSCFKLAIWIELSVGLPHDVLCIAKSILKLSRLTGYVCLPNKCLYCLTFSPDHFDAFSSDILSHDLCPPGNISLFNGK